MKQIINILATISIALLTACNSANIDKGENKLQYAEQLLRSAEGQNITQVAEICGFEDSNYFSKKFKEVYGISPKKVQKKD